MMKKMWCLGAVVLALLAPAAAQGVFGKDAKALANIKLYKTDIITVGTFRSTLDRLNQQVKAAQTLESMGLLQNANQMTQDPEKLLDAEIEKILFRQAAENAKIQVDPKEIDAVIANQKAQMGNATDKMFEDYLAQQMGATVAEYRDLIQDSLLQTKLLAKEHPELKDKKYPVSEGEILDVYDQKANELVVPRTVRYRYIMMSTLQKSGEEKLALRKRMDAFQAKVKAGGKAAFDEILQGQADDTSYEAGDIGTYVTKTDARLLRYFGTAFTERLFAMEPGQFSDVMETNVGYIIVNLTWKKSTYLPGLEDPVRPGDKRTVRDVISDALKNQKANLDVKKASADLVADLRKKADIRKFPENYTWKKN